MEQETLTTSATSKVRLELFEQGMISMFWDDIMDAVRANTNADVRGMAILAAQVRKNQVQVFGAWVDGRIGGLALTREVSEGLFGRTGLFLEGLYGLGLTDEQWIDAAQQLAEVAKAAGFHVLIGQSTVPRVAEIAKVCGYDQYSLFMKEL